MTANLVTRNGDPVLALVSPIASQAHGPDRPGQRGFECALSHADADEGYMRWRSTEGSDSASARASHRQRAHKLMVAMTDAEHEALALIAAKSGLTRHQVVRNALNGYFKWLAAEYTGTCRCISMLCSNTASATAESRDRRDLAGKGARFPRAVQ